MPEGRPALVRYDDSRWPVVHVTLPSVLMDDADYERHLAALLDFAARGERVVFVIDVRIAAAPNAKQRRRLAEFMDVTMKTNGPGCAGIAIVLTSPAARAVFKAVQWLRGTPHPFVAVTSPEEGLAWARELLRESRALS